MVEDEMADAVLEGKQGHQDATPEEAQPAADKDADSDGQE